MPEVREMNLKERLSAITSELARVAKNLNVSTGKATYKAVSEVDVLDAVKPLEEKYRVYSYPLARKPIESDVLTDASGRTQKFLRLEVVYRFTSLDTDEYLDVTSYGDGIDSGDKATGKAMTYADKYALMKMYKISTGDDPDKEASPEDGYRRAKATAKQVNYLLALCTPAEVKKLKKLKGVKDLSELDYESASAYIKHFKEREEKQ